VRSGGFGFEYDNAGDSFAFDTFSATGDVFLQDTLFVVGASLAGRSAEIITGESITLSDNFSVRFVEFDAFNTETVSDSEGLLSAADESVELEFSLNATATGLIVNFEAVDPNETFPILPGRPLNQAELDILAQGGDLDFGLPDDPGLTSSDGIFFENVSFVTATGDDSNTPDGLESLEVVGDISAFDDGASVIVRNADLTIGDDLNSFSNENLIYSFTGLFLDNLGHLQI